MADVDDLDIIRIGAQMMYDDAYDLVNVFHILVETESGLTWATISPLIQGYVDDLYDHIKATLHEDVDTQSISVANMTQLTTLGSIAWNPNWSGLATGDPTAAGVCCFAWARTYKPRVQLRKYLGVFGESGVTDGLWNGTVIGACEDVMTELIARSGRDTGIYFTGVAYNRTLLTYELGHSVDASAEPAYQRRRKRGRGS